MPSAARATRCFHCGYDLRGSPTDVCPECGKTKPISIEIQDPEQYHHARALLEHHKLLLHADQPGGSLGSVGVMYGASRSAWLWIDAKEAGRVEELLDEIGVNANIDVKPIVDRSEPICPKCDAELDPLGRSQCANCGTMFHWVEIEDPSIDPTGLECRSCGYELTGLTVERCPECNCEISDVERLAQAALGAVEKPAPIERRRHPSWFLPIALFVVAFALTVVTMNLESIAVETRDTFILLAVVLSACACLLTLLRLIRG